MKKGSKVFVGMSGGVDSSVSAYLLKKAGYNVTGVFIRTWQPDFIECTWKDERRDAIRACAHLDIPYLECDGEDAYKHGVADYMIEEYRNGRTPNPDVMCNREVKFGIFWQFAKEHGADFIATGHYAQNKDNILVKGIDPAKDQSYFLWTLDKQDLKHTLFPIGHLEKTEVRKIAKQIGLPQATKKDSQGVCFLGPLDMKEFLKEYIPEARGKVLLARPNGLGNEPLKEIGYHDGAVFYTLGERHGFTITDKTPNDSAYYIVAKNLDDNTLTVSTSAENHTAFEQTTFHVEKTNWNMVIDEKKTYEAQIRYHGEFLKCHVDPHTDIVTFKKPILVSSGQSIVVYDDELCVGGGIVK